MNQVKLSDQHIAYAYASWSADGRRRTSAAAGRHQAAVAAVCRRRGRRLDERSQQILTLELASSLTSAEAVGRALDRVLPTTTACRRSNYRVHVARACKNA